MPWCSALPTPTSGSPTGASAPADASFAPTTWSAAAAAAARRRTARSWMRRSVGDAKADRPETRRCCSQGAADNGTTADVSDVPRASGAICGSDVGAAVAAACRHSTAANDAATRPALLASATTAAVPKRAQRNISALSRKSGPPLIAAPLSCVSASRKAATMTWREAAGYDAAVSSTAALAQLVGEALR